MPRIKLRRRHVIALLLGALLGTLAILFVTRVYSPWTQEIEDPLVLLPEDADLILGIEDLPGLLDEFGDRPFARAVRQHAGLQRFIARDAELRSLVETVGDAHEALQGLQGRLPFDLSFPADLTGRRIALAAWAPEAPEAPWKWLLVARPRSWLALAGANVATDETLSGWFVDDRLREQGVEVRHSRDLVSLTPPGLEHPLHLTRIGDVLLLGSEERELLRLRNQVAARGVPSSPPARLAALQPRRPPTEPPTCWLLGRRELLDARLGVTSTLRSQWGPELYASAQEILPPRAGEDLMLETWVGSGAEVRVRIPSAPAAPGSLQATLRPLTTGSVQDFLYTLGTELPPGAFASAHLRAGAGALFGRLLGERGELEKEVRAEIEGFLAERVPRVGSISRLCRSLDDALGEQTTVVFFRQPRGALPDASESGRVFAFEVRDRFALRRLLDDLVAGATGATGQGEPLVKSLQRIERDGRIFYEPVLRAGTVDDPRVSRPGLVLTDTHLLATNFLPWLQQLGRGGPSYADQPAVLEAFVAAPSQFTIATLLDTQALFAYVDQSIDGWASEKTTPSQDQMVRIRLRAQAEASRLGHVRHSPSWVQASDRYFDGVLRQMKQVQRPALRQQYARTAEEFRGLISSAGLFLRQQPAAFEVILRLEVDR